MGLTKKKHYDSYTLAYKVKAVKVGQKKGVKSIGGAESLRIHPVMLCRCCQEFKEGRLSENKHIKVPAPPPKKCRQDSDALKVAKCECLFLVGKASFPRRMQRKIA